MNNELSENLLKINAELVAEILCRFIAAEIRRAGFQRVVVGLSGGIDSSVVTFLCACALGPQNVLAVTMPYTTSSEATRRDSQAVIERLGVGTSTCRSRPRSTPISRSFPTPRNFAWPTSAPASE